MNICFIGRYAPGSIAWVENLLSLDHKIFFVNTQLYKQNYDYLEKTLGVSCYDIYEEYSFNKGIINLFDIFLYHKKIKRAKPANFAKTTRQLVKLLKNNKFDLIMGWWGIDIINELYQLLFEIETHIPIVHIFNTYPAAHIKFGYGFLHNYFYNILHEEIAGRIFYSNEMKNYYHKTIRSDNDNYIIMLEPYLKKYYFSKHQLETRYTLNRKDNKPHIIFTGRTDFSYDPRRFKDNVKNDIIKISKQNIHIYIRNTDKIAQSDYIHFYPSFPQRELFSGKFSTYMHQFDASLVIYNEFAYKQRYKNGLSTRFAHSITAGIPIIARDTSIFAKNIFKEFYNGFTFKNYKEMKKTLYNQEKMKIYKDGSALNIENFSFENQKKSIEEFLNYFRL